MTNSKNWQIEAPSPLAAALSTIGQFGRLSTKLYHHRVQAIKTYVPITQAKAKLLDMVRQLHNTNDTIAITKIGIPEAVLLFTMSLT